MISRVEFEPLKEQWGEYELNEGLVLKARMTIAFIHGDGAGLRFATADQIVVHCSEALKGKTNLNATNKKRSEAFQNVNAKRHSRSLYLLGDGSLIDVRQRPVAFYKTNAFGSDGSPIVDAEWSISIGQLPAGPGLRPTLANK